MFTRAFKVLVISCMVSMTSAKKKMISIMDTFEIDADPLYSL